VLEDLRHTAFIDALHVIEIPLLAVVSRLSLDSLLARLVCCEGGLAAGLARLRDLRILALGLLVLVFEWVSHE